MFEFISNITIVHIIVVIVLLTLIYSVLTKHSDNNIRSESFKHITKSSGINDKSSKLAKKKILTIKKKTSKDDFLKTRIEHLNEQNNPVITQNIIDGYTNTLNKLIHENPNEIVTVGETNAADVNIPNRDFITNAIDNFRHQIEHMIIPAQNIDLHIDDGQIVMGGQRLGGDGIYDENILGNYPNDTMNNYRAEFFVLPTNDGFIPIDNFLRFVDHAIPLAKQQTNAERLHEAKIVSNNKEEMINHYLTQSETHTNDPQNSHDVQVNVDIKHTYDLIHDDSIPFLTAKEQAIDFINHNNELSDVTKQNALKTINNIHAQNRHVSVLNANESDVFARVWGRSLNKSNKQNSDKMKLAAIRALADSVENNNVVCANGVTSRILESPVTLDSNPQIGKVNTYENLKNMIFDKANLLIKNEIENAKKSDSPDTFAVGMYYENPDIPVDKKLLSQFETSLKNKLDELLGKEAKEHTIAEHNVDTLRSQLHAAIV